MANKIEDEFSSWRDLTNGAILESSSHRKIDFSVLIKKIFEKSSYIEPSVLDMISASESDVSAMQMDKWTLEFVDSKHEVTYKYERATSSSQTFRFVFLLTMIPLGVYIILDAILYHEIGQLVGLTRASFVIFFFVCIFLVFHPVFSNNYYLMSLYLLLLGVVCKIIVDWIQTEFAIAMTTIVGTSLLTFNFNLGAIKALMLNSLNSINFIIRIVVVYYAEGYNKIEITD